MDFNSATKNTNDASASEPSGEGAVGCNVVVFDVICNNDENDGSGSGSGSGALFVKIIRSLQVDLDLGIWGFSFKFGF